MKIIIKNEGRDGWFAFLPGARPGDNLATAKTRRELREKLAFLGKKEEGKGKRISGTENIKKEEVKINAEATINDYPVCTA